MCGIVGIWNHDGRQDCIREDLSKAVAALRHRGPDDEGIWLSDSGLGLGHTRLSILDLSLAGHQPMVSEDGRYVIVFNGEIYNFKEIRKDLISAGHAFSGTGDTETILHAFREWGIECVEKFIGMFAFALWDEQEQQLTLMRDRVGVKPLYYSWDGNTFCFGSELKALRAFRHLDGKISGNALGEYLQYGYIANDGTIYDGVHKLKPGHRLTLRRGLAPQIEAYWSVLNNLGNPLSGSDAEIEEELESLLVDCFRYRMVSDVPVGVYLSGGVDSSLVTALLAKHYDQSIRTFTIGFEEDSHDESRWAKKVAAHCGTEHTEYILGVREALQLVRDWGNLFDEPFGDSSGIPTLLVSRLSSEQVKVVLSADGGDELFSGYGVYSSVLQRMRTLDRVPLWLRHLSSSGLSLMSPSRVGARSAPLPISAAVRGEIVRKIDRVRRVLGSAASGQLMDAFVSYWYPDEINRLIGRYDSPRPLADSYPGNTVDQMSLWDFHHYLPEDILTKVDRTTMAVSIEGREPLLDHRLVEYAFRLPLHLRRGSLGPKHLLKKILYRHVPRALVDRPKQGFGIPLENWLRTDLKELVNDYLAESRIRDGGIMDSKLVRQTVKNFYDGDSTMSSQLWFILSFEMWREKWG